jgi:hypothetical protein
MALKFQEFVEEHEGVCVDGGRMRERGGRAFLLPSFTHPSPNSNNNNKKAEENLPTHRQYPLTPADLHTLPTIHFDQEPRIS